MLLREVLTNNELKEHLVTIVGLLSVEGIGPTRYHRLIRAFGSPDAVLQASEVKLSEIKGVSEDLAHRIATLDLSEARQMASRVVQLGWHISVLGEEDYPSLLANINCPPPVLFWQGELSGADDQTVAIVGTRRATEQGLALARELAGALAELGMTVVSGMAEGIDSAAHIGALEAGGRTIAVWGSSLDHLYPPSNRGLAERISTQGALLSEYLPDTRPDRATFPQRNRIISGMSQAIVVVQAGKRSGALITAAHALEQNRELFAVPGSPRSRASEGTNDLIKRGAALLTSVEDIFDALPRLRGQAQAKAARNLPDMTATEQNLIDHFKAGPLQIDQLSRSAQLPVPEVMELLLALELKGIVREVSGKRYMLSDNYL
ncbi:DNA-protecting protein DprA [candidate division GN15 bacterium]|nr:DNA-protecting protein DprA [candidate division GN15 bacterium]